MFDRPAIKDMAKRRLVGFRGNPILVALIGSLLGGGAGARFNFNFDFPDFSELQNPDSIFGDIANDLNEMPGLLPAVAVGAFVGGLIGLLCAVLLSNPIGTGLRGWFLRFWRGEYPSVGELFASFRIYKPVVLTDLLRDVYIFLWTLLFIIPGIVKSFAYSMADYIIYENPNLTPGQALEMSDRLTKGAKGDLFVFGLSFLGWELLNALTLGILGIVYVTPYHATAHAAVYEALKAEAIASGRMGWHEFGQVPPAPPVCSDPNAPTV